MTTASVQKTSVQPTWTAAKIQEEVSAAMMRNFILTHKVVEKFGPEAVKELNRSFTAMKVEYYRGKGVKTPLELVKAMCEFETNVFGSKMRYFGDDKQATVEYEMCGCYNAMVNTLKLSQGEMEHLFKDCSANIEQMAKEFGFKGEIKVGTAPNEPCCTMTFTR